MIFHREAMMLLALCHSVTVEDDKGISVYNSASPDELALV